MRYCICFSYEGTMYSGYQRQKGLSTIQEKIEDALYQINNSKKVSITSAGRTDKGVHAMCQIAHLEMDVDIKPYQLKRALNSHLPEDIYVRGAYQVGDDFHARYMVLEKTYEYRINVGEYQPLRRRFVYQHNYPLDIVKMQEAIFYLVGEHDFRAFVTENETKESCVRTITEATIRKDEAYPNEIVFTFKGKGFLRYQVRNMVGVLIKVGTGKIAPSKVKEILESKDRSKYGATAPACGLTLLSLKLQEPYQYIVEEK